MSTITRKSAADHYVEGVAAREAGERPAEHRLPTHDGETADEAVRLLCASHGLDPSRVEIVRR